MPKRPERPDESDDSDDEWPDIPPPYVGFVPLDDRMSDRKHTRRLVEELWNEIQRRLQHPWTPDGPS